MVRFRPALERVRQIRGEVGRCRVEFGQFEANLAHSGAGSTDLGCSWPILGAIGPFWAKFGRFGTKVLWGAYNRCGRNWRFWQVWGCFSRSGAMLVNHVAKSVGVGQNWPILCAVVSVILARIRKSWGGGVRAKLAKCGTKLAKLGQNDPCCGEVANSTKFGGGDFWGDYGQVGAKLVSCSGNLANRVKLANHSSCSRRNCW